SIDDQRHFLATISDEADRMAELLNHLLDLARQETGLLALKRAPYALSELVNRALKRVETGSNQIVKNLPAQLPKIDVDSARIEVVLRNLLANALEYGGGWVQIAAQSQHGQIIVSISDNGPGIAAEELQYLFERFYRARRGLERRSGGTGLGLAICRAFVVAHGGKIWVDSNASGTTVSFSLPI
ncbi:MAG: ATP-binding protein, partial [Chloroflexota bacterium]